jgi:3-deoxy-D-manno-octulosonate 8-phosphate phosphatase KdsC-like HAD superfamily phosphatase
METTTKEQEIEKAILEVGLKICKRGEGALILVGDWDYKPLVEQTIPPFNILLNMKLFESLALMDGSLIIGRDGILKAYGVMLKVSKLEILKNFGTRHNSGINASMKEGNTVYVISQEDCKIRIFKLGRLILEIDGRQKGIEKKIPEITNIMESVGWGTMSVLGAGLIAPVFGVVIVSGVTVFVAVTGVSYFIKKASQWGWLKK